MLPLPHASILVLLGISQMMGACCKVPTSQLKQIKQTGPVADKGEHHVARHPEISRILEEQGVDPEQIRCSTLVRWEPGLLRYAKRSVEGIAKLWEVSPDPAELKRAVRHALGYLVRLHYDQTAPHNLGVTVLRNVHHTDEKGLRHPTLLFRSAVISCPGGDCVCFRSLVKHGGVRHVVNLYGGSFPFRDLIEQEKQLASQLQVSYFDAADQPGLAYRSLVKRPQDYERNRQQAMGNLARLIREQLLRPGGSPPRGNLYVHCGGGMHRSGMLFGAIQRCVNQEPMNRIEAQYKRHTGYRSEKQPGGYEPLNLRFIREFDCSLLKQERM